MGAQPCGAARSCSISVVIPTRGRPLSVLRALRSVETQTVSPLEVIVVIDGHDPATRAALETAHAPVRILELPRRVGGAQARNIGIQQARGEWIALLDDDDEWLPRKLERQVSELERVPDERVMLSCRVICREPACETVLPRRPPHPGESLGEYLFVHHPLDGRSGLAQTSTLLASKRLLSQVRFDPALRRHQDPDLFLRAAHEAGARLQYAWEPLVVWNLDPGPRVSHRADWRHALDFADSRRDIMSARAYSAFVLSQVARQAKEQGESLAQVLILERALRRGAPTLTELSWYAARAWVPSRWKRSVRTLFGRLSTLRGTR
jgi:glycosyltransferase involved in cell wall biosynthesis